MRNSAILAVLATSTSLWAVTPAAAQDASGTEGAAPEAEEVIVVTGSRLPLGATANAPVTVLTEEEIQLTGAQSVGELLRELPAATAAASDTAGRGNNGSANVALRGLSAVNTLVLMDGRRLVANTSGATVDLNSIPFDAVERVEVLQDGASAVYGADAIAGVVNLIMKRSFDGLQLRGETGISSRGDLFNRELGATFGSEFDRGGFIFSANWRKRDGNLISDRPISRDPDWRSRGGRNYRDPLPIRSSFKGIDPTDPDRELIIRDGVSQATSIADFRDFSFPGTGDPLSVRNDGINYWNYESSAVDLEQVNLWFSGEYEITEGINAFVQAGYNKRESLGYLAPDYLGEVFGDTIIVSANNDFNPFGRDLSAARTIVEQPLGSRRQADVEANTYRFIAGLEGGLFADWTWDASYNFQRVDQFTFQGRGISVDRLQQAAGDSDACRAAGNGCVPINLFGAPGAITQDVLDFVSEDLFSDVQGELRSAVANVRGTAFTLPAGPVGLALGAEYREEGYSQNNNGNGPTDSYVSRGGSQPDFYPPTRKISEVYAETSIPLLRDVPFVRSLDVDLAIRFSDYSDFGSTTNPKVGVRWQPISGVALRGSWGTGFRAPTFLETYSGQSRGFRPITDPCASDDFASFPGCNGRRAITDSTGAWVISGGNPNLQPETAKNLTLGAVLTPGFAPDLVVTIDYYRIEKEDVIGSANIEYIIEQNALNGSFSDRITRDANNAIVEITATRDNLLEQKVSGFDFGLQYLVRTGSIGNIRLRADVTYLDSFKFSPAPGVAPIDRVGTYTSGLGTLPKWQGTSRVTWEPNEQISLSWGTRDVDGVTNLGSLIVDGMNLEADSYFQNDLTAIFDVEGDFQLTLGVQNIFDQMPPFLEGNYDNGFDSGTFSSRGTYFFSGVRKRF